MVEMSLANRVEEPIELKLKLFFLSFWIIKSKNGAERKRNVTSFDEFNSNFSVSKCKIPFKIFYVIIYVWFITKTLKWWLRRD